MKFATIKEYFYKLQSICYGLLLLPLAAFIAIYFTRTFEKDFIVDEERSVTILKITLTLIAAAELTIVHLLSQSRLKAIVTIPTLSDRLDKFVLVFILRTAVGTSSSLLMLLGFYLSGSQWFTGMLLILLLYVFYQRPTPSRVCLDLQLRGNEKELVLHGELK